MTEAFRDINYFKNRDYIENRPTGKRMGPVYIERRDGLPMDKKDSMAILVAIFAVLFLVGLLVLCFADGINHPENQDPCDPMFGNAYKCPSSPQYHGYHYVGNGVYEK